MPTAPLNTPNRPVPSFGDWALVAINVAFVVMGLIILPREPATGIVTLAFFGSCLAVSAGTVLRKLRDRRFTAERIAVAGGVPIRPSNLYLPLLGAWLAALGVVLTLFGPDYPLLFRVLAGGVAVVGIVVLALSITGRLPGGFLQFDPDALTIAHRTWRARIAWDNIAAVGEGELSSNAVLLLTLADPAQLDIVPAQARNRALRDIGTTQALMGADFMIMPRQYGIALPVLAATIARYVGEPAARAELRPRLT